MSLNENGKWSMGSEKYAHDIPVAPQESFVNEVYSSVDEAAACGLARLQREDGIRPSCKMGCCHCCQYHILTNTAEAHTLAQYVRRELSAEQTNELRMRTRQWHEWDNSRPGRYPSAGIFKEPVLSDYDHCCPLLVNKVCIAYPVRPVACRIHFVSSNPLSCSAANDPGSTEDDPVALTDAVTAAVPFAMGIKGYIEAAGLDFAQSTMLLPHGLAIEMGWDFALSL